MVMKNAFVFLREKRNSRALIKMAAIAIVVFLALNWVDYADLGDIFRQGKVRFTAILCVPFVFFAFRKKLSWAPAAFASLALLSFVLHDYQFYALFPLFLIFMVMGAACFIVELGEQWIGRMLVVSGAFQAVTALLQVCGVYYIFRPANPLELHYPVGLIGHESVLGSFLIACLPAALWRKNYYAAFLMTVAILATCSAMAYASLGAIVALFAWRLAGFRAGVTTAFLGVAAVGGYERAFPGNALFSEHGRFFMWGFWIRAFKEHPLFGSGIGGWIGVYLPKFKDEILDSFHYHLPAQAHCDYLDFVLEYGLVGVAPFLVAGYRFARRFRPSWPHATCTAILVNATGCFPLCLVNTALIFVVCWALANGCGVSARLSVVQ